VWQTFLIGPVQDAAHRRNPDTAREKYCRPGDVLMQCERSSGTAHFELGAKGSRVQGSLEASLAHAHRDHDWLFVKRRACERKGPGIVAFASEDLVKCCPARNS